MASLSQSTPVRAVLDLYPALEVVNIWLSDDSFEPWVTPSRPYLVLQQVDVALLDTFVPATTLGRCLEVLSNCALFPSIQRIRATQHDSASTLSRHVQNMIHPEVYGAEKRGKATLYFHLFLLYLSNPPSAR